MYNPNTLIPPPPPSTASFISEDDKTAYISHLDSLRNKLTQLHDSLNDFLTAPPHTNWPELLSKFNVLIVRYQSMFRDLALVKEENGWGGVVTRGLNRLRNGLVYPEQLPVQDPDFIPRVLLRTKLIPEIEKEEDRLRKLIDPDDITSETNLLKSSKKIKTKCEIHDALTDECLELFTALKDQFEWRMRLPGSEVTVIPDLEERNTLVDTETQMNARKETLEELLKWINSGPDYREAQEY